jgi:riboflavin biosynthesis pyrimidine reductase
MLSARCSGATCCSCGGGGPRVFSAFLRAGLADSLVLPLRPVWWAVTGVPGSVRWSGTDGGARPVTVESVRWLGEDLEGPRLARTP